MISKQFMEGIAKGFQKAINDGIEIRVKHTGLWSTVCVIFLLFWQQSGWYRIDCSLGSKRACDLINLEYEKKERP